MLTIITLLTLWVAVGLGVAMVIGAGAKATPPVGPKRSGAAHRARRLATVTPIGALGGHVRPRKPGRPVHPVHSVHPVHLDEPVHPGGPVHPDEQIHPGGPVHPGEPTRTGVGASTGHPVRPGNLVRTGDVSPRSTTRTARPRLAVARRG